MWTSKRQSNKTNSVFKIAMSWIYFRGKWFFFFFFGRNEERKNKYLDDKQQYNLHHCYKTHTASWTTYLEKVLRCLFIQICVIWPKLLLWFCIPRNSMIFWHFDMNYVETFLTEPHLTHFRMQKLDNEIFCDDSLPFFSSEKKKIN